MKKIVLAFLFILGFIFYSCSPMLYIPVSSDPVQQQKLLSGRKLYVKNCSNCHNLHLPKDYTADKWLKNLNEMQERSEITNEEKELIFSYLIGWK